MRSRLCVHVMALHTRIHHRTCLHIIRHHTLISRILRTTHRSRVIRRVQQRIIQCLTRQASHLISRVNHVISSLTLIHETLLTQGHQRQRPNQQRRQTRSIIRLLQRTQPNLLLNTRRNHRSTFIRRLPLPIRTISMFRRLINMRSTSQRACQSRSSRVNRPPTQRMIPTNRRRLRRPLSKRRQGTRSRRGPRQIMLNNTCRPRNMDHNRNLSSSQGSRRSFSRREPSCLLCYGCAVVSTLQRTLQTSNGPSNPPTQTPPEHGHTAEPVHQYPTPPTLH